GDPSVVDPYLLPRRPDRLPLQAADKGRLGMDHHPTGPEPTVERPRREVPEVADRPADLDVLPSACDNTKPMRILHTADWHLADQRNHVDRTADLRAAVERVARYVEQEKADVLLVAGDLFSEQSRLDGLRDSIGHLQQVFEPFLANGGTIVALTGNHDNE